MIKNNGKGTDKFKNIDDKVWNPVENTPGYIGCIGIPAGQKVSGVVGGDGFPVRNKHF